MAKQNDTLGDWAKQGFVLVGDKLVKSEKLVADKVEKIKYENFAPIKDSHKFTGLFDTQEVNIDYLLISFTLPNGEVIKPLFTFDLAPFPAPRMTRSDKWKTNPNHPDPLKRQRKPVQRYFAWKNAFISMCNEKGYTLQETIRVLFIMPLPKYLSRKKREMKVGQPHKQRPDTDNMIKAVKDAFKADDGFVWDERGVKIWGETGKIIIF